MPMSSGLGLGGQEQSKKEKSIKPKNGGKTLIIPYYKPKSKAL
jgi:hypothetical protein